MFIRCFAIRRSNEVCKGFDRPSYGNQVKHCLIGVDGMIQLV
jgi:hypothetical protein